MATYNDDEKVRDLMSTDLNVVAPSAKVSEAARFMRDSNIGSMPVVDQDKLVGIITDRDITVRVTADGVDPESVLVKEVMSHDLFTVTPDTGVAEAADLMARRQVRRLPVVEGDRLVGILALADIATEPDEADQAGSALSDISYPTELDNDGQQPNA